MLFTTPAFALFFIIVASLYYILPFRWRWLLLLISSYYFYASWELSYIVLLLFSSLTAYLTGYRLGQIPKDDTKQRKVFLALGLSLNLGVLFVFKYYNFFIASAATALAALGYQPNFLALNVILPVGISFYTFQSISYMMDVYRGQVEAEKHFGIFATYIALFPQLIAGPIERAGRILPQIRAEREFDYERTVEGFRLILWGAFKKIVIADRVAVMVNAVFNAPQEFSGLSLALAILFYSIQIYCDFSAYSDMAIGVAKVLGFKLILNFRQPYFAKSIQEFWQRWHISLSTWFRDYLYIPLGGNRVPFWRYLLNTMIVFVVSGLWHGAGWTFIIWGFLHGLYMVVEAIATRLRISLIPAWLPASVRDGLAMMRTFILVNIAWVFFRAPDFSSALYILQNLFKMTGKSILSGYDGAPLTSEIQMAVTVLGVIILIIYDSWDAYLYRHESQSLVSWLSKQPALLRWGLYYAGLAFIIGAFVISIQSLNNFIYAQF